MDTKVIKVEVEEGEELDPFELTKIIKVEEGEDLDPCELKDPDWGESGTQHDMDTRIIKDEESEELKLDPDEPKDTVWYGGETHCEVDTEIINDEEGEELDLDDLYDWGGSDTHREMDTESSEDEESEELESDPDELKDPDWDGSDTDERPTPKQITPDKPIRFSGGRYVSVKQVEAAIAYKNSFKKRCSLSSMFHRHRFIRCENDVKKLRTFEAKEIRIARMEKHAILRLLLKEAVMEKLAQKTRLHDVDVMHMAKSINKEKNLVEGFTASHGWISAFKRSRGIKFGHSKKDRKEVFQRSSDASNSPPESSEDENVDSGSSEDEDMDSLSECSEDEECEKRELGLDELQDPDWDGSDTDERLPRPKKFKADQMIRFSGGNYVSVEQVEAAIAYKNSSKKRRSLSSISRQHRFIRGPKDMKLLRKFETEGIQPARMEKLAILRSLLMDAVIEKLAQGTMLHDVDLMDMAKRINTEKKLVEGFTASARWISHFKRLTSRDFW